MANQQKNVIIDDALPNMLHDMNSRIHWKIVRCMCRIFPVQGLNVCKTMSNLLLGKTHITL